MKTNLGAGSDARVPSLESSWAACSAATGRSQNLSIEQAARRLGLTPRRYRDMEAGLGVTHGRNLRADLPFGWLARSFTKA